MNSRRLLFTAPRVATWEDVVIPDQLGPGDVLVRTAVSLVSAGTEVAIYAGTHIGFSIPNARWPRFPLSPGYAMAGTIVAIGSDVRDYRVGDRVAGYGKHATHYWCHLDTDQLFRLPDGVPFEHAVLARLADIALHGVRRATIQLGNSVVIFGQGLIGQFSLQLSLRDGARTVVAVDVVDQRLEISRICGATRAVNPSLVGLDEVIREVTEGHGFNVAIEATGNANVIPIALQAVGELGRVVLLGAPRGRVEIDPYSDVFVKGVSLIGAREHTAPKVETPWNPWTRANNFRLCLAMAEQGTLKLDPLISHRVPWHEAPAIFAALADNPADYLGVILDWRGE